MQPTVYLETTIVSYLVARPSRDLVTAAHQQLTREWWDERRSEFELFVSQAVIREASAGDRQYAALRLAALNGVPSLEITAEHSNWPPPSSAVVRSQPGCQTMRSISPLLLTTGWTIS